MAECLICGRTLKTGRKYCYIHRGAGREAVAQRNNKKDDTIPYFISLAKTLFYSTVVITWAVFLIVSLSTVFLVRIIYRLIARISNKNIRILEKTNIEKRLVDHFKNIPDFTSSIFQKI